MSKALLDTFRGSDRIIYINKTQQLTTNGINLIQRGKRNGFNSELHILDKADTL